ncbi:MAG: response regulator transcription factor, partial [Synergistaceae bacterium]|nr:response regulator transcription factor [Synergistaceae bacterium]
MNELELNIAVVDDTLSDVLRLKNFIQNYFYDSEHKLNEIISYSSGEELLKVFQPKMFNIVFMDIIMNDLNGVETSRQLRAEDTELLIIFMTTSREYAFDAFHVHPFDYVLKPYSKKDVDKVLDEAILALTSNDPTITIKVSHSEYTIPIRLISSVVSQGHTVEINLIDDKCILSNMKFNEIEQTFLKHENFLL